MQLELPDTNIIHYFMAGLLEHILSLIAPIYDLHNLQSPIVEKLSSPLLSDLLVLKA